MPPSQYLDQAKTFTEHDFGLDRRLIKACTTTAGFVYPTLVQSRCIPLALKGKDLLVRARTGSGKTAAFGLPLLQKILGKKEAEPDSVSAVRAVVLVPTRELCEQVHRHIWELMSYCRDIIGILALVDDNMSAQQAQLRDKPDIIVATPARLVAHLVAGNIRLKDTVQTLVVDEADLVLSFGYKEDIKTIMAHLPKICQGMLMSATLSSELEELKRVILHSPAILKLEEGTRDGKLTQFYLPLPTHADKFLVLFSFLKLGLLEGKGLFFVNSTDSCYRLKLFLEQFHIRSAVLNSELPLNSRLHILQEYNSGIFDYLIATDESMDVTGRRADQSDSEEESDSEDPEEGSDDEGDERAKKRPRRGFHSQFKDKNGKTTGEYGVSRGVDFRGVQFVLNVDFPQSSRSYTHRVGRTARGGASGTALSLVCVNNAKEMQILAEVRASQPPLPLEQGNTLISNMGTVAPGDEGAIPPPSPIGGAGMGGGERAQPAPLSFDLREVEQFRYRVTDTAKKVTKIMVKEARLSEIRQELVNSKRLDSHFKANPDDLRVLRHDKAVLHPARRLEHLKHVPGYLMPEGLDVGEDPSARQKRKRKRVTGAKYQQRDQSRRKDNDPLQSFDANGLKGGDDDNAKREELKNRVMQTNEYSGKSMSGRQQWKQKHHKGKFGGKYDKGKEKKAKRGARFSV